MAGNLRLRVPESQLGKGLKIEPTTDAISYFYKLMQEHEILKFNFRLPESMFFMIAMAVGSFDHMPHLLHSFYNNFLF